MFDGVLKWMIIVELAALLLVGGYWFWSDRDGGVQARPAAALSGAEGQPAKSAESLSADIPQSDSPADAGLSGSDAKGDANSEIPASQADPDAAQGPVEILADDGVPEVSDEKLQAFLRRRNRGRVDAQSVRLGQMRSPSVIIEKSKGRLTVYDGGRRVKRYRAITGAKQGDKLIEGDRKTPEGKFYICVRKTSPATPYVRSMGLSYPNVSDARRGLAAGIINSRQCERIKYDISRKRQPSWKTKLGGEIMIHGKRGNRTGTLGCIALSNSDVIELYPHLPLGTPVEILP